MQEFVINIHTSLQAFTMVDHSEFLSLVVDPMVYIISTHMKSKTLRAKAQCKALPLYAI